MKRKADPRQPENEAGITTSASFLTPAAVVVQILELAATPSSSGCNP